MNRRLGSDLESGEPAALADDRDKGAMLIMALVVIIIATLIVTPMLTYAIAVTHSSRLNDSKSQRLEAVKGGLRTALADPTALYKACNGAGVNSGTHLSNPALSTDVDTYCYLMQSNFAEDITKKPYGVSSVQANAPLPTVFTSPARADVYPGSGQADPNAWRTNDTSLTRIQNKIWTPNLPVHALSPRSSTPYPMSAGFPACNVFFPGTYVDPIVLSSTTPYYFTSGIYYFENSLTITGDANVVAGGGTVDGCTTDQYAVFYAINAPSTHNITGLGATFVFGMTGRLIVNNSVAPTVAGNGPSLVFNQRYVNTADTNSLPSATVNIMSVNGELLNSDLANTPTDLIRTGVLSVPLSQAPTSGNTFGAATLNNYRPSTLVPPDPAIVPAPADTNPIIDISLTAAKPITLSVPGYVDVPQGRVSINIPAGSGFGSAAAINFSGGVLARKIEIPGDNPSSFSIGVAQVVTQLVLRIKTTTLTGTPTVTSDAIVQVNANGAYAINSWAVG